MKDKELQFDRNSPVLYTKACKKAIKARIAIHFPPTVQEQVWGNVQRQYVAFLSTFRTDLGGKKQSRWNL